MIATLYLVMVMVMVGMNYKLKARGGKKVKEGSGIEEEGKTVVKSSSISFTEGRGTFSTLVSASTKSIKSKVDV